jgi:hypothetical protein
VFFVLWAIGGTPLADASAPETHRSQRVQDATSLDQILDNLMGSALNPEGLDHSNLAIDQIVQKSNKLIRKASRERNKVINGKNQNLIWQLIDALLKPAIITSPCPSNN